MRKIRVGIIGCGAIGSQIAMACTGRLKKTVALSAICDADMKKALVLKRLLGGLVPTMGPDELIRKVNLVVEAASAKVSPGLLGKAIKHKRDILIMSVGGLLGRERLLKSAAKRGVRVYLPSGAICGLDGMKAASIGKISSVTLTTRKHPRGLEGAPYLKNNAIDLKNLKRDLVIFEGSAINAVKGFPQNINVSALLALAGLGPRKTTVRIIASPGSGKNVHEVEIVGDFGRITTRTENVPSKANPKTSSLAILSAIATLDGIAKTVRIGT